MSDDSTVSFSVLDQFLVGVVRLAAAQAGIVRAKKIGTNQSHLVASCGLSEEVFSHETSITGPCGICGEALREECIQVAERVAGIGGIAVSTPDQYLCTATIAVPLVYQLSIVGVLTLYYDDPRCMPDEFIRLLHPAGQLLALALEDAQFKHSSQTTLAVDGVQSQDRDSHDLLAQSLLFIQARLPLLEYAILHDEREHALTHYGSVKRELGKIKREMYEVSSDSRARGDLGSHVLNAIEDIDANAGSAPDDHIVSPARSTKLVGTSCKFNKASVARGLEDQLTPREREILEHVALGSGNKAIARALNISHETVKLHVRHIRAKLGFSTRLEAALFAINR